MRTDSKLEDLLEHARTRSGVTLASLSEESPLLLVLLRHEGCLFCRNAMSDIARMRTHIEETGTRIVLGHMGSDEGFHEFAQRYGLGDLMSISDPEQKLYSGLGLRRGTLMQLLSPRMLWRWLKAACSGHRPGRSKGDIFQLPGAFLIENRKIIKAYPYQDASDRPNYIELATP